MPLNHSLWVAASEIRTLILIIHGEKAHSRYFGEDAFKQATSGKNAANKQLLIAPEATHCDLYDGGDKDYIPWKGILDFYYKGLNLHK